VHVAFALLTLFPGRVGGSESYVRGLLGEFAAGNGPERVTVLANGPVMKAYRERAGGPVALRHARGYRAGESDLTRLVAMSTAPLARRRLARDLPGDVDVLHHPVTVPIPRMPGVPTVTTVHDLQHRELPGFFSRGERLFRRWAYEGAARRADLVLTPSEHARERLIEIAGVPPERAAAVPLGIDHGRFRPEPTDADATLAERLSLPGRYVVYPANLWPHKNHARLIEAFSRLPDDGLELVLSGQDYGRRRELEEQARRLGIEGRVTHLGYLEPEDVPALYRGALAMAFPSLYEGFGSPPLEAMACGCPVASSTRGSLAEVLGDAALSFDPESADDIAAAIARLAEDGALRERLIERGLERARGFTWEAAARRHLELYELARTLGA